MEGIASLVPLILVFLIMYFLLIRPQQKKLKEHQALVSALRRGDQVVTAGGIVGRVTKVKDNENEVEVKTSTLHITMFSSGMLWKDYLIELSGVEEN